MEKILFESKDDKKLMVVLDDQYYSKNLAIVGELYLVTARHRSISVIFLTQSIFNNPHLKNISRSTFWYEKQKRQMLEKYWGNTKIQILFLKAGEILKYKYSC